MWTSLHSSVRNENIESRTQIIEFNREKNGYGFTISGQAPCFVSWVVSGGPAHRMGLDVGDCIISVNGENTSKSSHEEVVKLIGISFGTLLLGIDKNLESVSQSKSGRIYLRNKLHEDHNKNSEKPRRTSDSSLNFSRTDKVLKDLYSGEIFKGISPPCKKPSEKNERRHSASSNKSCGRHQKETSMVVTKSVVAYLGTVEMAVRDLSQVEKVSLEAIKGCIYSLRKEQHIHQRVLMTVTHSSVKLYNADKDVIAIYKSEDLCFSSVCPEDSRFFCLVTAQDSKLHGLCCHVFMVDPNITPHSAHEGKAKRFGIQCLSDPTSGECIEFPRSPQSLLSIICLLYTKQDQPSHKNNHNCSAGKSAKNTSFGSHTMGDAPPPHKPRTEPSLPPSARSAWVHTNQQVYIVERIDSNSGTNDDLRLSPRVNNNSMDNKMSQLKFNYSSSSNSTNSVDRKTFKNERRTHNVAMLSRQNVGQHNNLESNIVPPPMDKLSMGKYRMQDSRAGNSSAPLMRKQNRAKPQMNKNNHKRNRLFNRHFTTRGKAICQSTENVAVSDEDGLSGASSVESLASNASLPSCLNGSLAGNFDYRGHQRASLRQQEGFAAGRVPHWAVSFERLLDDPLGVKYFREFLCKEYSEENILFWEACENFKRNYSLNDDEKLKTEIKAIYDRFLAPNALMPVNIDSHGQQLAAKALTSAPRSNIFFNQQHQVFTLMKLDSYSRFLKSPLYRQCMLCEMESRPLPLDPTFQPAPNHDAPSQDGSGYSFKELSKSSDSGSFRKKDKKSQKASTKRGLFGIKSKSSKSSESFNRQSSRDSSGSESLFSNSSLVSRSSSLTFPVPEYPDPARVCQVALWDGSSTVVFAKREGTVGEALGNLCDQRGVKLEMVTAYLCGADGERVLLPLGGDVDALASRTVILEKKTMFRLDMLPIMKTVGVKSRPNKTIREVLVPVLGKYQLDLGELNVHTVVYNERIEVNLSELVSTLDDLKISVEQKSADNRNKWNETKQSKRMKNKSAEKKEILNKSKEIPGKQETEELISLVSSLQSSTMQDQRGLLNKEDLELPDFLKIKPEPHNNNNNNNNNWASSDRLAPLERGFTTGGSRNKGFVELSSQNKRMSSFKPDFRRNRSSPDPDSTLIADPEVGGQFSGTEFDLDATLQALPTPPPLLDQSGAFDRSVANFSPPTPIKKNKSEDETIMV